VLLVAAVGRAIKRSARRPLRGGRGSKHYALLTVFALLALLLGTLSLLAVRARSFPAEASTVPLAFPLRDGVYYVSDGGSNGVLNIHQKAHTPNQHYAIDVQKMSALGSTARSFRSTALENHHVFGEEVRSPCAGRVADTRDGVADHVPFQFDMDDPLGNHVVIDCQGVRIVMLHLKQGSILVEKGERLARGQPVGQVGNSGFSSEPHLHLQATRVSPGQSTFEGQGVPMLFGGRLLKRNDLVMVD
jgi:murein DD-endopeptidase MepM/ murein hydrolase activator NlpD